MSVGIHERSNILANSNEHDQLVHEKERTRVSQLYDDDEIDRLANTRVDFEKQLRRRSRHETRQRERVFSSDQVLFEVFAHQLDSNRSVCEIPECDYVGV